jgi:hypothetical protein
MTGHVSKKTSQQEGSTYAVECIEESVEQVSGCNLLWLVELVVNLIEGDGLRVDESIS